MYDKELAEKKKNNKTEIKDIYMFHGFPRGQGLIVSLPFPLPLSLSFGFRGYGFKTF
jgi:hypothetical protein